MTEEHDPDTGEIIEQRAADGGRMYPAANTFADFIRMVEDGQFDADVQCDLKELAADMVNQSLAQGGGQKIKAKLDVKIEFVLENGIFYIAAAHKVTKPVEKRPRSVLWTTEDNRFTPHKPRQSELFGRMRDVNSSAAVRDA